MSDADDYARLMSAFDELVDARPAERASRLDVLRTRDPALARAVEELVDASRHDVRRWEAGIDVSAVLGSVTVQGRLDALADLASGPTEPRPLPVDLGETLGGYRLDEVLGHGGMGCVYRATHVQLGRPAAVKVLDPRLTEDAQYVSRFLHEAKIVSALRHPNVVEVFDFVETESPRRVAFVMELLPGATLTRVLAERALTLDEAVSAGRQLCSVLAAVHERGVVHRDLKPDNVFVVGPLDAPSSAEPSLKLLDFGIAKVPDPLAMHQTATGMTMGTPAYMAPEQFAAEPPTPATDVYALAELLYEALARKPAFGGRGLAMIRMKMSGVPPPLELPPGLPHADTLRALLQACLRPDPASRPSIERIDRELAALRGSPMGANTESSLAARSVEAAPRRSAVRSMMVGVSLAAVLAVVVWSVLPNETSPSAARPTPVAEPEVLRAVLPAVVYGEPDEINTPYVPSGYMGDSAALTVDPEWTGDPHAGETCMRIAYGPPRGWAGIAWLDPADDWGERPGGLALNEASTLSFWARSDLEGLELRVGYGLLLRDVAFFDSTREDRVVHLTREWRRYTFDLRGKNLARIKSGFYFSLDAPGPGGPHHFYFDDIRYE